MQKCEIMLNDLIDSKRTNTNIKKQPKPGFICNYLLNISILGNNNASPIEIFV